MKAVHCTRYGGPEVLELKEVPVPVPKPNQVLIRVHAASVTLGDCELRKFQVVSWAWVPVRLALGVTRPRQPVLGMEVAGEVVAVGEKVTRFQVGERVSGSSAFAMGAYQEFVALS
ncbi:alcohol dehydrogenase catalytic domain-containing protein, partial [Devosia sp.]|uniref:alcohol dehydrogenase catalytic domain-containing protein n=1 Tax=Devosia sp. TaxID=1871048 RepID=UPI003A8EDE3E